MASRVKRTLARLLFPFSVLGTAIGGITILKDYMGGVRYQGEERIAGKTAIVTGANSGIGKAIATGLADRGARIIMACRDFDRCEEAKKEIIEETANRNVCCQRLDLASIASITAFAEMINKYEPHVDILINNAGVMMCPKSLTQDGFEQQLGVNYLGHFLLTVLLMDKMKKSAPSRILNICSYAFRDGVMNWTDLNSAKTYDNKVAFCQSHLAKVLFTVELEKQLKGTGVTANAVYPGLVRTNITSHLSINKSYISSFFLGPLQWIMMKNPVQGAQTPIYCSVNKDIEKVSGKFFRNCQESPLPSNVINPEDAKRLWLVSEKWLRLT